MIVAAASVTQLRCQVDVKGKGYVLKEDIGNSTLEQVLVLQSWLSTWIGWFSSQQHCIGSD